MRSLVCCQCLFILTSLMLSSCASRNNKGTGAPPPPVAVNVYTVEEGNASFFESFPGTVAALNEVQIRPQVGGYITGIYFKDGQRVMRGQDLYSIDPQQYKGAYDQALANLNVAKANLARAQQDADRYTELAQQDAIAKQTLDHALADLESSKMQVEAAKANVSAVQTNLKYAEIIAPFDGTIGISQVKIGGAVSPGTTLLNTISSDDPVAVDFAADEKKISRFEQLQKIGTNLKDSTFMLQLPDGSIYSYPGNISVIDRAVDPLTGTIKVRIVFRNPGRILKAGMNCNLKVRNNHAVNMVMIPYRTVVEQMGEYYVYVVGDSSKVSQRKLALGTRIDDKVIVNDGLHSGEKIVIDGIQKLRDGARVQIGIK